MVSLNDMTTEAIYITLNDIDTSSMNKIKKESVTRFLKKGYSNRMIADELGVTPPSISYWMKKIGLKPNPQGLYLRSKVPFLKDSDRSYLAGFWDGEGSISLHHIKGLTHSRFQVDNTNKEVISWIRNVLQAGSIIVRKRKDTRHKTCYRFSLSRMVDIKEILTQIIPYLKIKRDLALKAIEFFNLRLSKPRGIKTYSRDEFKLLGEIKSLNRRGGNLDG